MEDDEEIPTFPVAVDSTLDLDPASLAIHQGLANQLSGRVEVPGDRLTFYSHFVNSPDYTIAGWQGILVDVDPDPSGSIVTVAVIPNLRDTLVYKIEYNEQFLVDNNGGIQYLGSSYPAALAGQFPTEFEQF